IAGKQRTELVRVADLELLRGDCVGLLGPNGSGKTTLLRTIIGELSPLSGQVHLGHNVRIGYYSQTHAGLNAERSIIDEIRQVSFFFSSRRRHTMSDRDWSSDVCSSDLPAAHVTITDGDVRRWILLGQSLDTRSEERRVGKECRCGRAGAHRKKERIY